MSIQTSIQEDLKAAMKGRQTLRLETLRTLRAQFLELAKRGSDKGITPDEEIAVLMTAIKKRKEAIEMFEKGGRADLAAKEKQEIEIISAYLPPQLNAEEAEAVIRTVITQTGASSSMDFGKVMSAAMKELKGKIDGKVVQDLVRKHLGG
ncbi:MAG: GatB/YqeY domain-containing protein [Ignavibacteria bacterium]|nr:GatB/YqeY domain-containing protein [Ignavibacteria bacterium]